MKHDRSTLTATIFIRSMAKPTQYTQLNTYIDNALYLYSICAPINSNRTNKMLAFVCVCVCISFLFLFITFWIYFANAKMNLMRIYFVALTKKAIARECNSMEPTTTLLYYKWNFALLLACVDAIFLVLTLFFSVRNMNQNSNFLFYWNKMIRL